MELSTIADWLGVIGGLALGASWLWKLQKWLRTKIEDTKEGAALGSRLVAELLEQATSPARRADIHAFIQFRCIEFESSRTRHLVCSLAVGAFAAATGLLLTLICKMFDADLIPSWLWWLSITNYGALVVALGMMLFFGAQRRHLEAGWQDSARTILQGRAFRHVQ